MVDPGTPVTLVGVGELAGRVTVGVGLMTGWGVSAIVGTGDQVGTGLAGTRPVAEGEGVRYGS